MKAPLRNVKLVNAQMFPVSRWHMNSHQASSQEDDGIDDPNNPLVSTWPVDAKFFWERQVSSVGAGLVPTLRGGTHSTKGDRIPHHLRAMPFVILLILERSTLFATQIADDTEC